MKFVTISVGIALIFSPIASAIAFIITYSEYLHHYPDKKKPVTLVFFIVLSFVIGFLLENMVGSQSL